MVPAHQRPELFPHDLHDLMARGQALQHLLADRLFTDVVNEVFDDLEMNIRLKESQTDFLQRFCNVLFRQDPVTTESLQDCLKLLAEGIQHVLCSSEAVEEYATVSDHLEISRKRPSFSLKNRTRRSQGRSAPLARFLTERFSFVQDSDISQIHTTVWRSSQPTLPKERCPFIEILWHKLGPDRWPFPERSFHYSSLFMRARREFQLRPSFLPFFSPFWNDGQTALNLRASALCPVKRAL